MEIVKVSCNSCGAMLAVGESTRFVTCRQCGVGLEIKRTESAVFSEVLPATDQRAAGVTDELESLRRQQEVNSLDIAWQMEREKLMISSKHGRVVPSAGGGVFLIVFGCIFGGAIFIFGIVVKPPIALLGFAFSLLFIFLGNYHLNAATTYQEAERDYHERRSKLTG